MMEGSAKKATNNEEILGRGLIDLIFSWSITDVMNKNLFSNKVKQIPTTFSSTDHYFKSFIYPLIEETHCDLCSSMTTVSRAPFCEVNDVKISKDFKLPKDLYYLMSFKKVEEKQRGEGTYKPQSGDLVVLTSERPRCIDDLNTSKWPYTLAVIQGMNDGDSTELPIVSSKPIEFKKTEKFFVVYLINLTTNIRIWKGLYPKPEVSNMSIISKILHCDSRAGDRCDLCSRDTSKRAPVLHPREAIRGFGLDNSQESAVLDCLSLKDCHHKNIVKLIWGPPGTGKTKTVASLLTALLKMKCRTLICAPTNIAVLGVTNRLMNLLRPSPDEHGLYGLGDILLFGNGERMKIDDNEDVHVVFQDTRVSALSFCLAPVSGWKGSVQSVIRLLEAPEFEYQSYLWKERENHDSFDEFFSREFSAVGDNLLFCITSLYTHLPTFLIQEDLAKEMIRACELFRTLKALLSSIIDANGGLREALNSIITEGTVVSRLFRALQGLISSAFAAEGTRKIDLNELKMKRSECLQILKYLENRIRLSDWIGNRNIVSFCLESACLIFCTASSSARLNVETKKPLDLLVIDEAAQLKECESTIPLQLTGLRHAILVGDEMQLPAMVQSKICERADFGRSLFERLVTLGHEKHLLNVQYRMHPSISLFPNREFYDNKIRDGPNVTDATYNKQFLEGFMFGPCSFIDIHSGREEYDDSPSKKNVIEASVVGEIVAKLRKECVAMKQKCQVGCISPYKDQVREIQERLGKTYDTEPESDFSVDVRSVDGYQGGERDVIIISTVRCNGSGSIGFLSNHQRTNVALTRARHCIWILGNSATLLNSGSIWEKFVVDMKARGCFFNATEDKAFVQAISCALIELKQFDKLFNIDSLMFKSAKWKVCFSHEFSRSLARIQDSDVKKEAISIISKLSSGWRLPQEQTFVARGSSVPPPTMLEIYNVNSTIKLIWNTDIQRESSFDIQVITIQDIVPVSQMQRQVVRLNAVFGKYTMKRMNRCTCKQFEGDLVVPMKWPGDSSTGKRDSFNKDHIRGKFTNRFAQISLNNG